MAIRAIDHFGRLTEPKHLTEQNAWTKDYDWRGNADESHRYFFSLTNNKRTKTIDRRTIQ